MAYCPKPAIARNGDHLAPLQMRLKILHRRPSPDGRWQAQSQLSRDSPTSSPAAPWSRNSARRSRCCCQHPPQSPHPRAQPLLSASNTATECTPFWPLLCQGGFAFSARQISPALGQFRNLVRSTAHVLGNFGCDTASQNAPISPQTGSVTGWNLPSCIRSIIHLDRSAWMALDARMVREGRAQHNLQSRTSFMNQLAIGRARAARAPRPALGWLSAISPLPLNVVTTGAPSAFGNCAIMRPSFASHAPCPMMMMRPLGPVDQVHSAWPHPHPAGLTTGAYSSAPQAHAAFASLGKVWTSSGKIRCATSLLDQRGLASEREPAPHAARSKGPAARTACTGLKRRQKVNVLKRARARKPASGPAR